VPCCRRWAVYWAAITAKVMVMGMVTVTVMVDTALAPLPTMVGTAPPTTVDIARLATTVDTLPPTTGMAMDIITFMDTAQSTMGTKAQP